MSTETAASASAAGYPDTWYLHTARGLQAPQRLTGSVRADVCVIGAGYTGLSTALHLRQRGYDVVVLEARRIGWGASGRNGGQVGSGQRMEADQLQRRFGADRARRLWDLAEQAKALVRGLVEQHDIDCDLAEGQLVVAAKPSHVPGLMQQAEFLRQAYGYQRMRFISRDELSGHVASTAFHGGLLDTGAMHLHALNYALGLARACREAGVKIFEDSPVCGYSHDRPGTVDTREGAVTADILVVACNGYLESLEPRLAGRIMPINNFIVTTAPLPDPQSLIPGNACIHDTRFVVNYFRRTPDGRLLFGGGENYRRRFPADIAAFVRPYLLRVFPQLADTDLEFAWGGTLAVTLNRLPHLGMLEPNLYFAHGFSGHGISMGTLAGRLIAEAVAGERRTFDELATLPTRRFPGGTLLRWPGMVAGMLYYALRDRL